VPDVRVHVFISGRVQGVSFRYFAQEQAIALNLIGWVRNRPDGRVEAAAEGPRPDVEKWLELIREGPSLSRVVHMEISWYPPEESEQDFIIRA
jgi:acylphosphatase